jgi:hypothetical protein
MSESDLSDDASKLVEMAPKPRSARYLGISLGDTRLLPRWCPAYRQHEPGQGSRMERTKVSSRNRHQEWWREGEPESGSTARGEYRSRGTLADCPVVAKKPGNAGGAKGMGRPDEWMRTTGREEPHARVEVAG